MDIGSAVSRQNGVSTDQQQALPDYETSKLFGPLDRLALNYADEMTRTPVAVPEPLFAALRAHLSEAQLVELTATIAWENYRARFNRGFAVESDGFSQGSFCMLLSRLPKEPADAPPPPPPA